MCFYMAINTGSVITPSDISNGFVAAVKNVILANAYDVNNIPMDGQTHCIEPDRLGNKNNLPEPSIGIPGAPISASQLYDNLCYVTTVLTRVGTFSYLRTYQYDDTRVPQFQLSGKALFNDSYTRTLAPVTNPGIYGGQVISAAGLNSLFANLLDAWNRTSKHHNNKEHHHCHSNCHNDCYSDCHGNCNCYK